jgi:hypothetical protein
MGVLLPLWEKVSAKPTDEGARGAEFLVHESEGARSRAELGGEV